MSKLFAVISVVLLLTTGVAARAQADMAREGVTSNGLCGLALTGYPLCAERLNLSATGGYGYTESIGQVEGSHHRLGGSLGGAIVPLPWLAVALRLDGRLDLHPNDARGKDLTGTGDPRIFVRAGRMLGRDVSLGGEGVLWFPGAEAPSFEPKATSVDLKALVAWRSPTLPFSLLGHVGVRLDQSANSAPEDLARLRPGDRLALGLSDSHAVLLALGSSVRVHPQGELFGELALDLLVGEDAPEFAGSPMRAAVGGRAFVSEAISLELSGTIAFQQRPSLAPTAPLVPIEPRVSIALGLRYAFDLHPPKPVVVAPVEPPREPEPAFATVTGVLLDDQGAPLPDVRVVLRAAGSERESVTDAEGRYTFADVPVGPATLESSAMGFELTRWEVDVRPNLAPLAARPLSAKGNAGTLRVLARTFTSEPLAASIQIRDTRGRKVAFEQTDAQGRYELELPPGEYVVLISAPGYRPHRRAVRIERYAVAILNVDLSAEK